MWIFSISLVLAMILSGIILSRDNGRSMAGVATALSVIGFGVCVGALFGLKWLHLEPLQAAEDMLQSFNSIDLSGLPESLKSLFTLSPSGKIVFVPNLKELLNALGKHIPDKLAESVLSGQSLNGWQVLWFAYAHSPWLTVLGVAGLGLVAFTAIFNTLQIWSGFATVQAALRIINTLLWFAFVMFLSYLPLLDTFGTQDDLSLRLIMVLAQTRLGMGAWLFTLGIFLNAIAGLSVWSMSSAENQSWNNIEPL